MGIFIGGTGLLGLAIVVVVILIKVLGNATATRCAACLSVVHPQATICPHCGTGRKMAAEQARPRELTGWEVVAVIGVLLAVASVGAVILGAIFQA